MRGRHATGAGLATAAASETTRSFLVQGRIASYFAKMETLADGTERVITAQAVIVGRVVSSRAAMPARKAVNPVVHGNVEDILFLDVAFLRRTALSA